MADREQLLQALRNADAAAERGEPGAVEDARKLAAMLAAKREREGTRSSSQSTTEDQPENLSLKREDRIQNHRRPSFGFAGNEASQTGQETESVPKVEDSINMKKFWEERLANGLYGQGGLCDSASSPSKKLSASAALLAATAASAGGETSVQQPQPTTNNYLASFNLIAEAELAALYNAAQANNVNNANNSNPSPSSSVNSSPTKKNSSGDGSNPISIRSFCVQEGNTYRCKVCNNA